MATSSTTTTAAPATEATEPVEANVGLPQPQRTVSIEVTPEQAAQIQMMLANLSTNSDAGAVQAAIAQQQYTRTAEERSISEAEQALKAHQDRMKDLGIDDSELLSASVAEREMRVRDKLTARALRMDYAPKGGQSIVDGVLVWNLTGTPVGSGEAMPRELVPGTLSAKPWTTAQA